MTARDTSDPYPHGVPSRPIRWGRELLILGVLGFALYLSVPQGDVGLAGDKPANPMARQSAPQTPPRQHASPRNTDSRSVGDQPLAGATPAAGPRITGRMQSSVALQQAAPHVWELDAVLAKLRNLKELTPGDAKEAKRLLQELQKRGFDAVLAIRDFLRSQEDMNFDRLPGGKLAGLHTLRAALFDALRQLGGDASIAVLAEQLGSTQSPAEIATLARILDELAPGAYRDEAIRVATNALSSLASTKDPLQVRPLFEWLRELGGAEAAVILGQYPANSDDVRYLRNPDTSVSPTVRMYALMALANLPDGEGVFALMALGTDPRVPMDHRTTEPFRMLAQAAADQGDAAAALLTLASSGQIPDRAWAGVADALAGKQLQFPSRSDIGLSGMNGRFSRGFYDDQRNLLYEERTMLGSWSIDQIQQQLALIDSLLSMTKSPGALSALQAARTALQNRR
jgi:hypothetical protein